MFPVTPCPQWMQSRPSRLDWLVVDVERELNDSGSSAGMVDTHWRGFISSGRSFSNSTLNSRYAVIGMTKRQPAMPIANIQLRTRAILLNNPGPRTRFGHLPRHT